MIDEENLSQMSDEDYFASMKMMFRTDGWQILLVELKQQADLIGDIQDIKTIEGLHFHKGQLNAIGRLLNFEETLRRAEDEAEDTS